MKKEKTILYVDDEPLNLLVFKATFRVNYNIVVANNGEECLSILKELDRVDFLISDMQMPGMNGVELIAAVKEEFPELPCYILTGYDCNQEISNALAKGFVNMYFSKPFDKELIDKHLQADQIQ